MAKTPATDPRFDPRFQRGYDGPQPDAPATPAVESPVTRTPPARSTPEPVAVEGSAVEQSAVEHHAVDEEVATPALDEPNLFWTPPRRNPFALALLLGSLAMIAVGVWLLWTVATASSFPNGYTLPDQIFALVQNQLTPALFVVGLLGIVGWLVLGALEAPARKRD